MTKLLSHGLTEKSILRRLYADQIEGKVPFKDAAKFIWRLSKSTEDSYELITSRYWVEKEDITQTEYESNIIFFKGSK
jgi:hypothetical protein